MHENVPLSGSIRFERGAPTLKLFNDEVGEAINSDMKVAFPQPHTGVSMHFKWGEVASQQSVFSSLLQERPLPSRMWLLQRLLLWVRCCCGWWWWCTSTSHCWCTCGFHNEAANWLKSPHFLPLGLFVSPATRVLQVSLQEKKITKKKKKLNGTKPK